MTLALFFTLLVISLIANGFSALSGGGAGLIQFPALIFLGLSFSKALATHKVASVALGLGASIRHLKARTLCWPETLIILGAGLPGVVLGSLLIFGIPDRWAMLALGVLTCGLGIYSIFKPQLGLQHQPRHWQGSGLLIGMLGLFVVGVLNGSVTSGTGLFLTVWLIRWFGLDYQHAVAYTLVLCGILWNGAGAIVMGVYGQVQWLWLPALLIGSVVGGYVGTRFALAKGNRWMKRAFEFTTLAVGIKLIVSVL